MNLKDNHDLNKRFLLIMAQYKKDNTIKNSTNILAVRVIQTPAVAAVIAVAVMMIKQTKIIAVLVIVVLEQQFQKIKINNIIDKSFSSV